MIEVARREAGLQPAKSPYLNDPNRLGFWLTEMPEWNIGNKTGIARAHCAEHCNTSVLRPSGWTLQLGQKVNLADLAAGNDTFASTEEGWIVVGGDLFYVDKVSEKVMGVVRHFMNLKEYGRGFNKHFTVLWGYRMEQDTDDDDFVWSDKQPSDIAPTEQLRSGNFGGDTPQEIPGGKVIKAEELARKLEASRPPLVVSSIGGALGPLGTVDLSYSTEGGTYTDATQQRLEQDLKRLTDGDESRELVFYCHHAKCWMSYNSALRAIKLGYKNVYWFRGGLNAWAVKGYPMDWVNHSGSASVHAGK